MRFAITRHSPYVPPSDALGLLWEQVDGLKRDGVSFARFGSGITDRVRDEPPIELGPDEWADKCRRLVLEVLRDVCARTDDLDFDWFAVSERE